MSLLQPRKTSSGVRRKYYALLLIFFLLIPGLGAYLIYSFLYSSTGQRMQNMATAIYYGYADWYLYYITERNQLDIQTLTLYYLAHQNWITQHPQVSEYDYIIGKWDNGTYYALNGETGTVVYSGDNAGEVIQNVINALGDGVIFFRNGNYSIDTTIEIPFGIYIVGSGYGKEKGTTIIADGVDVALFFNGTTSEYSLKTKNGWLKNIKLCGNGTVNSVGVRIQNYYRFVLEECYIYGFYRNVEIITSYEVLLSKNLIKGSYEYGVYSTCNESGAVSTTNYFEYNTFYPCSGWAICFNKSNYSIVENNWFEYFSPNEGSHVQVIKSKVKIIGNTFGSTKSASNYGIKIGQSEEIIISNNNFNLNGTGIYIDQYAVYGTIDSNVFRHQTITCNGNMIESNSLVNYWVITNNVFEDICGDMIYWKGDNSKITGNVFQNTYHNNNDTDGIVVTGEYNVVSNNYIKDIDRYGLYVTGDSNLIEGNYLIENGQHGLLIYNANNNSVISNIFKDNGQDTINTYDAIRLVNANDTWITGNNIYNSTQQRYGVSEGGTSDYNIITVNRVGNQGTARFNIIGTHSQEVNNY